MGCIISVKAVLKGQDIIAMDEIHRSGLEFFKS